MDIIEVHGLTKAFKEKKVLNAVSFSVKKGEVFGFLGPNGAGKTTTMFILLGLLQADSGTAEVMGGALGENPDLRRKTGVVLEKAGLYDNFTAAANLSYFSSLYGRQDDEAEIETILKKVGLGDAIGRKVGTFSTGMKKRLALARALLHDPEVLFLDEPTTGLDPEAQIEFRSTIQRLSREREMTVFLNSHNLDEVQKVCTSVAVLDKGTIRAWDTLHGLRQRFSEPTILVEVRTTEDAEKAQTILENDPAVASVQREGTEIICNLTGTEEFDLKQLVLSEITIDHFSRSKKTLEEVYMDVITEKEG